VTKDEIQEIITPLEVPAEVPKEEEPKEKFDPFKLSFDDLGWSKLKEKPKPAPVYKYRFVKAK